MQVQCHKCKEWTDDETGTCALCGAVLYEMATQEDSDPLPVASKESQEDVVKNFLKERRASRIRNAIRIICFGIAATGITIGYLFSMQVLYIPAGIALLVGLSIKLDRDSFSHLDTHLERSSYYKQ